MRHRWIHGALLVVLVWAVVYVGRVYVAMLRPAPVPTATSTPTGTPTPSPASTRRPTSTPTMTPAPHMFDGYIAYQHVLAQLELGPRVPGSEASQRARLYIRRMLEQYGWKVEEERFVYRGVPVVNLIAQQGIGPVVALAAHYDSRARADNDPNPAHRGMPVPGANDGASGVAVLLELARVLSPPAGRAIWLYFFDGEDQGGLNDWPWAVGARYAARNASSMSMDAFVLLDMVGDVEQQFYWEGNSDPELRRVLWQVAAMEGYEHIFIPQVKYTVQDDHVPFREQGIRAVDIIDLDYPYWHTIADTADKVSPESLARVGRVILTWFQTMIYERSNVQQ